MDTSPDSPGDQATVCLAREGDILVCRTVNVSPDMLLFLDFHPQRTGSPGVFEFAMATDCAPFVATLAELRSDLEAAGQGLRVEVDGEEAGSDDRATWDALAAAASARGPAADDPDASSQAPTVDAVLRARASAAVDRGEPVLLVGPPGCGKRDWLLRQLLRLPAGLTALVITTHDAAQVELTRRLARELDKAQQATVGCEWTMLNFWDGLCFPELRANSTDTHTAAYVQRLCEGPEDGRLASLRSGVVIVDQLAALTRTEYSLLLAVLLHPKVREGTPPPQLLAVADPIACSAPTMRFAHLNASVHLNQHLATGVLAHAVYGGFHNNLYVLPGDAPTAGLTPAERGYRELRARVWSGRATPADLDALEAARLSPSVREAGCVDVVFHPDDVPGIEARLADLGSDAGAGCSLADAVASYEQFDPTAGKYKPWTAALAQYARQGLARALGIRLDQQAHVGTLGVLDEQAEDVPAGTLVRIVRLCNPDHPDSIVVETLEASPSHATLTCGTWLTERPGTRPARKRARVARESLSFPADVDGDFEIRVAKAYPSRLELRRWPLRVLGVVTLDQVQGLKLPSVRAWCLMGEREPTPESVKSQTLVRTAGQVAQVLALVSDLERVELRSFADVIETDAWQQQRDSEATVDARGFRSCSQWGTPLTPCASVASWLRGAGPAPGPSNASIDNQYRAMLNQWQVGQPVPLTVLVERRLFLQRLRARR